MDTRDTPEQAELRRAARRLARELGPATVAGLDDAARTKRLGEAVRDSGWLELRDDAGDGAPLAGGVEASIVADALGGSAADTAFTGPLLARDLARRAGVAGRDGVVVGFSPDLTGIAVVAGDSTTEPIYAVDSGDDRIDAAYVLVPDGAGHRLGEVRVDGARGGSDLTRSLRGVVPGARINAVAGQGHLLTRDDLVEWTALGLALTSADLVGAMRGVLDVSVAYAADRRQYGVPVGSFQAVQHLLADAHCLTEGSLSVSLYASWAVDNLPADDARAAGRVAKAYCARAARTVCETAVQVHGGIGNTWECIVHVYLRRALLSSELFGDGRVQLQEMQRERLGVADGLS
jgi:Acyl-CoA dehydrogenase, C-terminal domain